MYTTHTCGVYNYSRPIFICVHAQVAPAAFSFTSGNPALPSLIGAPPPPPVLESKIVISLYLELSPKQSRCSTRLVSAVRPATVSTRVLLAFTKKKQTLELNQCKASRTN